ncbi:hypothetical protein PGB90_002091 [Kerria lacca]
MITSTPAPTPSRANYGFALYLASYTALGLYLIWTFLPDFILEQIGFTFLPQKYWSVAVPIHACVTLALVVFVFYPALNLTLVPKSNDMSIITDEWANYTKIEVQPDGVPPIYDLHLKEVCETLFL